MMPIPNNEDPAAVTGPIGEKPGIIETGGIYMLLRALMLGGKYAPNVLIARAQSEQTTLREAFQSHRRAHAASPWRSLGRGISIVLPTVTTTGFFSGNLATTGVRYVREILAPYGIPQGLITLGMVVPIAVLETLFDAPAAYLMVQLIQHPNPKMTVFGLIKELFKQDHPFQRLYYGSTMLGLQTGLGWAWALAADEVGRSLEKKIATSYNDQDMGRVARVATCVAAATFRAGTNVVMDNIYIGAQKNPSLRLWQVAGLLLQKHGWRGLGRAIGPETFICNAESLFFAGARQLLLPNEESPSGPSPSPSPTHTHGVANEVAPERGKSANGR